MEKGMEGKGTAALKVSACVSACRRERKREFVGFDVCWLHPWGLPGHRPLCFRCRCGFGKSGESTRRKKKNQVLGGDSRDLLFSREERNIKRERERNFSCLGRRKIGGERRERESQSQNVQSPKGIKEERRERERIRRRRRWCAVFKKEGKAENNFG